MQEMTIDSVHISNYQWIVILKEKDADRYLPIFVGPGDAHAIEIKLRNHQVSRPLTHNLLYTVSIQ